MRRFQLTHTRFSILFPALLFGTCNALNFDRLAKWFYVNDHLDYLALSAYLLAGLCLFIVVFALLAHRWTIKPFAVVLTIVSAAAAYFIAKYNVAIDSSMVLNTIHTDTTEVGQLLSVHMVPYVVFLIVLPVLIILSIDITFQPSGKYLLASLKLISICLLVAIASLYANYKDIHRAGNISNKYIVYSLVPINILSSSINVIAKALKPYLAPHKEDRRIIRPRLVAGQPGRRACNRRVVAEKELQPLWVRPAEHQSGPAKDRGTSSPERHC
jgi:lipid A ethanolaminephosphotransferase